MTAIFAYAFGDYAFVAGDTLRNMAVVGPTKIRKVHAWSGTTLLAQAGDGVFQTGLIEAIRTKGPVLPSFDPLAPADQQFLAGYKECYPAYYKRAQDAFARTVSGDAHISGTILVTSVRDATGPARIHKVDFATGSCTTSTAISKAAAIAADGTDPAAYAAIAHGSFGNVSPGSASMQVDRLGVDCVEHCINSHPGMVGWPVDVILTRPSSGERIVLQRRVDNDQSPRQLKEFKI